MVAKEAFVRMDQEIDLWMHAILTLTENITIEPDDYLQGEFSEVWKNVPDYKTYFHENKMFYKSGTRLFCERKMCVPKKS